MRAWIRYIKYWCISLFYTIIGAKVVVKQQEDAEYKIKQSINLDSVGGCRGGKQFSIRMAKVAKDSGLTMNEAALALNSLALWRDGYDVPKDDVKLGQQLKDKIEEESND